MSPEGMAPQTVPGTEPEQEGGGVADALSSLQSGINAMTQGLTDAGAPQEVVALANDISGKMDQLMQMVGAGQPESPEPSAQEMTNA